MPSQHRSRPRTRERSTASTAEALRSIFNRNFNVVACINLLVMTAYYLMFVTSTAYAQATYGASLSSAGLTAGIMVIGCLIGRFLTGNLLSLFGFRIILFAGLLLYSASIAAFFWVPSLALLFVQRLCMGLGVGIMGTATGTIVAYVVPHQHHGLGISLFSMSTAFALALGPFLGILISHYFSYTALAQTCLGIGLACIGIFFGLHHLPEMHHRHRPFLELNSYIDPRVVRFSLVALITCLSYGCIQAFMTSYAAERGLTGAASLFFLLYALAALVTRPLTGRLFDLRGENIIFYPALLLTALSLTMMAHASSGWMPGWSWAWVSAISSPPGRRSRSRWCPGPALPRPPRPFSSSSIWASAWGPTCSASWSPARAMTACTRPWPSWSSARWRCITSSTAAARQPHRDLLPQRDGIVNLPDDAKNAGHAPAFPFLRGHVAAVSSAKPR